jgi:hypothetical protein
VKIAIQNVPKTQENTRVGGNHSTDFDPSVRSINIHDKVTTFSGVLHGGVNGGDPLSTHHQRMSKLRRIWKGENRLREAQL